MFKKEFRSLLAGKWKNPAALLLIAILGSLVYANAFHSPFQFDDYEFLLGNPFIKDAHLIIQHWDHPYINKRKVLTYLSFALNYALGKEDTFGYNVVNVGLHIATASLLYYVILNLFKTPALRRANFVNQQHSFALIVALLFLVHPLQTQSVTYIWERSEVLSAVFYLAAYLCYLAGRLHQRNIYYLFSGVLFYVGIFTKGLIVSLPIMIFLSEMSLFERNRKIKNLILVGLLVLGTTTFFLWYTRTLNLMVAGLPPVVKKFFLLFLFPMEPPRSLTEYTLTQLRAVVQYIKLSFLPLNQNLYYYFPSSQSLWEPQTLFAFCVLLGIFGGTVYCFKKQKLPAFGICWFFICLIPTSLGAPSSEPILEHRVYLSLAGFAIFITTLLFIFVPQQRWRNIIAIGLILNLCVLSIARNYIWGSVETLMEDTIKKSPLNPMPYVFLGTYHFEHGEVIRASELLKKAVSLAPGYAEAHNNLGLIYIKL